MNIEKAVSLFWQQGFLHLKRVFDEQQMANASHEIDIHFGDNPKLLHEDEFLSGAKTEVVPWFPQREGGSAIFDEIESNVLLNSLTEEILGEGWQSDYSMVMFSAKNTSGQAWHQDCTPSDHRLFNLNRLIYSHDLDEKTGGYTAVVPGSHKLGLLPAGDPLTAPSDRVVTLKPKRGDLLMLHGHTWHRVLPTNQMRRHSINYRSVGRGVPKDLTDICVYRNMRYRFSTSEVIEARPSMY
ncbi:MAG: phytanoyl-CoA dioxygenase family protein [Opitutae bacterium]